MMLLLSFMVFGWGLHYKLSLYDLQAHTSAPQVAAKLLSPQERTTPQAEQSASIDPAFVPVALALLLTAFLPAITGRVPARKRSLRSPHPGGMSMALLRRPPPAATLSL